MSSFSPARILKALKARFNRALGRDTNAYLWQCRRVLHVGANDGYERDVYAGCDLDVLWVEALPAVYEKLVANLRDFPRQKAVQALVTDRDGDEFDFHVSNNDGLSSSIFDLKDHRKLWPEVEFTQTVRLRSSTLETVVRRAGLESARFDALILDVQGAEHLVLAGAGKVLDGVTFVDVEVADFESYAGACTFEMVTRMLEERGFGKIRQREFMRKEGVGGYYEVLFKRKT